MKKTSKNEDDLINEDSIKNEDNLKKEDKLKNEDNLKNEDDLKYEDNLKNEDVRKNEDNLRYEEEIKNITWKNCWWLLSLTDTAKLTQNRKWYQLSKPEIEFNVTKEMYAALSMRTCSSKTTF